MKISISGQYDVPDLPSGTQVVVALSPGEYAEINPDLLRPGHLWLPMEDTVDRAEDLPPRGYHLRMLQRVLDRMVAEGQERLHIACWAGISRSTALGAAAIAYLHPGMSDRAVAEELYSLRPEAPPNELMVEKIDFQTGRNLTRALDDALVYG